MKLPSSPNVGGQASQPFALQVDDQRLMRPLRQADVAGLLSKGHRDRNREVAK
jgi:hypothetical protein